MSAVKKGLHHSFLPRPKVEFLDKEVSHHTLHLAEARGEGRGFVSEGLDEAGLVLLSVKTKDEGLLKRLDDFMSPIHQDACGMERESGSRLGTESVIKKYEIT